MEQTAPGQFPATRTAFTSQVGVFAIAAGDVDGGGDEGAIIPVASQDPRRHGVPGTMVHNNAVLFAGVLTVWVYVGTYLDRAVIDYWMYPRGRHTRGLLRPLAAIHLVKSLLTVTSLLVFLPLAAEAIERESTPPAWAALALTCPPGLWIVLIAIQATLLHAAYRGQFFSRDLATGSVSLPEALLLSTYCNLVGVILALPALIAMGGGGEVT